MDDIDTLRNEALRLLASANRIASPAEQQRIRRRAARMIELADRIERRGSTIMTEQPSMRSLLRVAR